MTAAVAPAAGGRIRGIDAARALAIVGMVMVHVRPFGFEPRGIAGHAYDVTHGRASILFVLLAGIGVSLLAGDRSLPRLRSLWARLAFRAAVLLPAGLALQLLEVNVLVILQYYAVYFLVAAAGAHLPDRWLLGCALALVVVAPIAYLAAWHWQPAWFAAGPTELRDPPAEIVRGLLLTGSYPTLTWSAPLLFGVWLGRRDLRARAVRLRMVTGGALVAVAAIASSALLVARLGVPPTEPSWQQLLLDDPHSQMPLWLLGSTAVAVAVLGSALVVVDRLPRLTWPLVATGQLALTVYVAHLFALHRWPEALRGEDLAGATTVVAGMTALAVALSTAWRAVLARGPLEALLRAPWFGRPDSA